MRQYVSGPVSEDTRYERFEYIMDNIPAGILTVDESGVIEFYSRVCANIFGWAPADVLGRNIDVLIPKLEIPGDMKPVRNVDARRKTGNIFPIELHVSELRLDKRRVYACVVHDITERRAAEEDVRRSRDEMEQFAYIASHDLRAPLRGIDNLAQWIGDDLAAVMTPEADKHLKLLRKRVGRIERLLEDILSYSRAGRVTEAGEKIDVGELIAQVAEPVMLANKKFKLEVAGEMPVLVSPRTPLEQVFSNLISNAIRHHDKGEGTIRISVAEKSAFYEFAVGDDGPGIAPDLHERAFQLFQTLKPRDKTDGGTGLGLSIVKKLVEWQGGKVWIVSDGSRGTEIRFLWRKS
jgi:PAS domain S-box-containing protein